MWILYFVAGMFAGVALSIAVNAVSQSMDRYLDGEK